jgi:membrane-associated protein
VHPHLLTGLGAATALGPEWLQPDAILQRFGTWALIAVLVILFVECGLLIFFLPGDSLLFVTGLFIATGAIATPLWLALLLMTVAAVGGNLVGYWVGARVGPPLFERPNSRLIQPKHVRQTHDFFEKYGARSIVLGRFVPVVRTFITALAGVGRMNYATYARYSVIGGAAWVVGVTMLGYWLGDRFPFIEKNLELVAVIIVAISLLPIGFEIVKARREQRTMADVVEDTVAGDSDDS